MTDAEFLHSIAVHFECLIWTKHATRLRAIALEHERMERELTRLMQEGREANAVIRGSGE